MNSPDQSAGDALESIIRRRVKSWAAYQAPPREIKLRLLQAVRQPDREELQTSVNIKATHPQVKDLDQSRWRQHLLVNYLMLDFRNHSARMLV